MRCPHLFRASVPYSMTVVKDTGVRAVPPPFDPEHEELRETVRRFVSSEIAPNVDEWEAAREFPRDLYRRCAELGFLGLKFPESLRRPGRNPPPRRDLGRGAGALRRLGRGRGGPQRPRLDRDAADLQLRHRGAEAALAGPGHRRREDRGARHHRARRRLRRRRDLDLRRADRRRLRRQRLEDLHHQRRPRRLPRLRLQDDPGGRPSRNLVPRPRERDAGIRGLGQAREARLALIRHRRALVQRRRGARPRTCSATRTRASG